MTPRTLIRDAGSHRKTFVPDHAAVLCDAMMIMEMEMTVVEPSALSHPGWGHVAPRFASPSRSIRDRPKVRTTAR